MLLLSVIVLELVNREVPVVRISDQNEALSMFAAIAIESDRSYGSVQTLGTVKWGSRHLTVQPWPDETKRLGFLVDGKQVDVVIGRDAIADKLIGLDYRSKRLHLWDASEAKEARDWVGSAVEVDLRDDGAGNPQIELQQGGKQRLVGLASSSVPSGLGLKEQVTLRPPEKLISSFASRTISHGRITIGSTSVIGLAGGEGNTREWISIYDLLSDRLLISLSGRKLWIPSRTDRDQLSTLLHRVFGLPSAVDASGRIVIRDGSGAGWRVTHIDGIRWEAVEGDLQRGDKNRLLWLYQRRLAPCIIRFKSEEGVEDEVTIPAG